MRIIPQTVCYCIELLGLWESSLGIIPAVPFSRPFSSPRPSLSPATFSSQPPSLLFYAAFLPPTVSISLRVFMIVASLG